MKFKVRKPKSRLRGKHLWHNWFAWHPVRVPTYGRMSGQTLVWLQFVRRKGKYRWGGCVINSSWTWVFAVNGEEYRMRWR